MLVRASLLALLLVLCAPSWAQDAVATWPLVDEVMADDLDRRDRFGSDVALDGDFLLVGADGTDLGGQQQAGAAYVLRREGDAWVEEA